MHLTSLTKLQSAFNSDHSMAAVEEEVAVEPSSEPAPKEEMPEAPAEPAPQPEPVAAPAVVAAAAPITPAASTEITEVIVDVEPSPGAAKFFNTVGEASSTLSTLNSDEVSDGMLELSKRCKNDMKSSFDTFKTHALDVAVVATSTPPSADERAWKLALKQTEWRKQRVVHASAFHGGFREDEDADDHFAAHILPGRQPVRLR